MFEYCLTRKQLCKGHEGASMSANVLKHYRMTDLPHRSHQPVSWWFVPDVAKPFNWISVKTHDITHLSGLNIKDVA